MNHIKSQNMHDKLDQYGLILRITVRLPQWVSPSRRRETQPLKSCHADELVGVLMHAAPRSDRCQEIRQEHLHYLPEKSHCRQRQRRWLRIGRFEGKHQT